MKIALFNNSHLPVIGGKEIVVHHLAMSLLEMGHDVVVIGPGSFRRFRKVKFQYKVIRWPRIPLIPKEITWKIFLVLSRLRFRFDILHAHTTYPNGYIAACLKPFLNYSLIITPHGEDIHKVPEINFGDRLDPLKERKICQALRVADFASAISKAVAHSLEDAELSKDKIVGIPNGVDIDRFSKQAAFDVNKYLGFPRDTVLIVTVGNYHVRKGHEVLVESLKIARKSNSKIRLAIVGTSYKKFCDHVDELEMADSVKFVGSLQFPIPGKKNGPDILVALLKQSVAYVSSSIAEGTEGLSLAILEAMASGTCVIATNVSGSRDVIVNEKNGILVNPASPEELARALVRVSLDIPYSKQLGAKGLRFTDSYSWNSITEQYVRLYKRAQALNTKKNY